MFVLHTKNGVDAIFSNSRSNADGDYLVLYTVYAY